MTASAPLRPKARLKAAQSEIEPLQIALQRDFAAVRTWAARHRGVLAIAGGFVGGLALSALPRRFWRGVGGAAAGTAAAMARSMLAPMIAGALFAKRQTSKASDPANPEVPAEPPGDS